MALELLKRVQSSTALNTPTTAGELPQHQYPNKPHQVLVNSTVQTDLAAIHEFLAADIDELGLDNETRTAWEKELKTLQARYYFTASKTNKWSKYTFDTWQPDVTTVVLMHVVAQYSKIESSAEGSGARKLFEPSTAKDTNTNTARSAASKFCPELLYDHGLRINETTIEKDLDDYAKLIHPTQYTNSKNGSDRQKQAAQSAIDTFKDNTKSTIQRVNKIVSHEVERLLLAIMPQGRETPIFKMLHHYRSQYIETEYGDPNKQNKIPYNAAQSFKFLRDNCTGSNERMAALYSYVLIDLERQPHQNVLDWSRSFLVPTRMAEKFRDPFTTEEEKHTYYHDPFVGQLTNNEIQKLNAGNFLIVENELFDKEKLENYVSSHTAQFPTRYIPDKRTKDFINNKRKLFASAYPRKDDIERDNSSKKRKHSNPKTEHSLYTDNTRPSRQDKAKGSPSKGQQYHKGRGNKKGSSTISTSKGNKGKTKSAYEPSYYGNRASNDKWQNRPEGNAHGKGSQNTGSHKGKGKGKPRTLTSRKSGPWCTFCRKSGHTRANCFKVQKLQRTQPYKNILLELEDNQHELLNTAIDSHASDYCSVCHDPDCPVDKNCLDPMSECMNGPSEAQIALQNILYMEEHEPLLREIEKLKPDIGTDDHIENTDQAWSDDSAVYWQNTESAERHTGDDFNQNQNTYSGWDQETNSQWKDQHSDHERRSYYE